MDTVLENIRRELEKNIDEKTRVSGQRFFKEPIKSYGVNSSVVNKISKEHFKALGKFSKSEIFGLCEKLWKSGYLEESFIACNWSFALHTEYEPDDFKIFEKWIALYVNNWASCDTLCNHTTGSFVEMFPEYLSSLKIFAKSDNRWMRRASAVTLIIPARKGLFLKDILEISDILLSDKDDMVQKGYGWMLKAASQYYQQEIFEYVMKNKKSMPRTALRYAIEKMPKELKMMAMDK